MPTRLLAKLRAPLHATALFAALLAAGCDELSPIPSEEGRAVLGVAPASVCPDPVTGEGRATVVAQVFASDGTPVTGGEVSFTSDRGLLESFTDVSRSAPLGPLSEPVDALGQARVALRAPRAADNGPVHVEATTLSGQWLERDVPWPSAPQLSFLALPTFPAVGQLVSLRLDMTSVCNVVRLRLVLEYDPSVLEFVEGRPGSVLETAGSSASRVPTALDATETAPGRVSVDYRQTGTDPVGTSLPGTFLTLVFLAREPGDARLQVPTYAVTPVDGSDYPVQAVALPPLVVEATPS